MYLSFNNPKEVFMFSPFYMFAFICTQIGGTVVSYMDGCCKTCEYLI